MRKILTLLFFAALAGPLQAQTCPDFFRFVDFGLIDGDGNTYRGGPVFRAEGFDETPLLLRDQTECTDVRDVLKDGRGNPIPVATRITYDPAQTGLALQGLHVSAVGDTAQTAAENASAHLALLAQPGSTTARGDSFLCAQNPDADTISCQLASPYPGNTPLVVYCNATSCDMPVMAINDRLMVSAAWSRPGAPSTDLIRIGADMSDRVRQIHAFLTPISSGW